MGRYGGVATEAPMANCSSPVESLPAGATADLVEVAARIEREGRRVQMLQRNAHRRNTELCRATGLGSANLRISTSAKPPARSAIPAGPAAQSRSTPESDDPAFHRTGVERCATRVARSSSRGPRRCGCRLTGPVVAGQTQPRCAGALRGGRFGNGVSAAVPWGVPSSSNTDLTVYLHRQPEAKWIASMPSTDVDRQVVASPTVGCTTNVGRRSFPARLFIDRPGHPPALNRPLSAYCRRFHPRHRSFESALATGSRSNDLRQAAGR